MRTAQKRVVMVAARPREAKAPKVMPARTSLGHARAQHQLLGNVRRDGGNSRVARFQAVIPPLPHWTIHVYKCHLCGRILVERTPGGTRENDGLETGIMGAAGRENSVDGAGFSMRDRL